MFESMAGLPRKLLQGLAVAAISGVWIAAALPSRQTLPKGIELIVSANRVGYLQPCTCTPFQKNYGPAVEALQLKPILAAARQDGFVPVLVDAGHYASGVLGATETLLKCLKQIGYVAVRTTTDDLEKDSEAANTAAAVGLRAYAAASKAQSGFTLTPAPGLSIGLGELGANPSAKLKVGLTDLPLAEAAKSMGGARVVVAQLSTPPETRVAGNAVVTTAPDHGELLAIRIPLDPQAQPTVERIKILDEGKREPMVEKIIDGHFDAAQTANLRANSQPPLPGADRALACGSCHAKEYDGWLKSKHAHAIPTLEAKKKLIADCLPCHSTQFRLYKSFDRAAIAIPTSFEHESVTCITCHGDGARHSVSQAKADIVLGRNPKLCGSCHDRENSPKFDFKTYLAHVHG
jgi:hypothetical protein